MREIGKYNENFSNVSISWLGLDKIFKNDRMKTVSVLLDRKKDTHMHSLLLQVLFCI